MKMELYCMSHIEIAFREVLQSEELELPMLPEVASGMIHPRDISIPIRTFCKRAKFYQAVVSSINLEQNLVTINRLFDGKVHALEYDILVLAMGSITNFFGKVSANALSCL